MNPDTPIGAPHSSGLVTPREGLATPGSPGLTAVDAPPFDRAAFDFLPKLLDVVDSIENGLDPSEAEKSILIFLESLRRAKSIVEQLPGLEFDLPDQERLFQTACDQLFRKRAQLETFRQLPIFTGPADESEDSDLEDADLTEEDLNVSVAIGAPTPTPPSSDGDHDANTPLVDPPIDVAEGPAVDSSTAGGPSSDAPATNIAEDSLMTDAPEHN
ncbi:hypothetical protein H696_01794 [Fonticula alba]|uniref:Mediator of RNA polymerase II transcription subunit 9 n=1 Tax=Fonticula alba TaxID=691883 RepID=A0A058ZDD5_FONAL|nr:hypothetical protein H696_01794 [Fonticula alba]KCV72399.1 hypothetical protein H696_01794 [Fonticula alba]|eukprot:XP_009493977.1 hypothetical protein H696_01794 [Fonticula alba]